MSAGLAIDINKEVFKIKDPRVERLSRGELSAELFVHMIGPGDPFMLVDGCVYALSEDEFYATRAVLPVNELSERSFHYVLDMDDLSFMHKLDSDFVAKAKLDLPNCAACTYRRYKDEIAKLIKKYNIQVPDSDRKPEGILADKAVYPAVSTPVLPIVSLMLRHMYRTEMPKRRSCIDCVEKHLSQAYVLAGECVTGYPEHIAFVIAHLGEAIDEMPDDMQLLKNAVVFCLAKTKKDGKPFVPVCALLPLLNLARYEMDQSMDDQRDSIYEDRTESMDIDFTEGMKDELGLLPSQLLLKVRRMLWECLDEADSEEPSRIAWEGRMASAAESCAQMAPLFANMLRNRRLLFIGDVSVAGSGEWGGEDVIAYIDTCLGITNKN